jgi:hypothetical protein
MERTHGTSAEASTEGGPIPPGDEAGPTGTGMRQVLVIAAATVIGWVAAVDDKPWWRWMWDAVSTGFTDTDRYTVDWRLFLSAVALGVALARWLAGRGRTKE